ncbi:hypothetical protein HLB44_02870 [Aquincola sp. S2]|uniref:DUF2927 domain-containing protein n=1 Tax=Pseudaquabacterium terrae TaxID=2732868 RepID=A0ABX2ED27_9BURK|nr:hypothetical protein [Aquabacterium terrae]NRF65923.1 hypothetical protein [Aquabacterium terrae]
MRLPHVVTASLIMAAVCAQAQPAEAPEFVARLQRLAPVEPFGRPVLIRSEVEGGVVRAEIEALIDRPFRDVQLALADPPRWCAAMILHISNTGCRAAPAAPGSAAMPRIALRIARHLAQPPEQADELDFSYHPMTASTDRLSVRLHAAKGFLGTHDHGLMLDAAPAGAARTALRLSYTYRQTPLADWSQTLWLGTFGRGKVGFSSEADDGGSPLVGGIRGLIERNLVRYLFAIEAAARTPAASDRQAYQQRLRDYFDATERHPRQLRQVDLDAYLALKLPLVAVGIGRDQRR